MSDISNYALTIDTTRMSNAAARGAVSTLIAVVPTASDPARAIPLLELLGEFVAKASQAGL
jgi:hypothetical protein